MEQNKKPMIITIIVLLIIVALLILYITISNNKRNSNIPQTNKTDEIKKDDVVVEEEPIDEDVKEYLTDIEKDEELEMTSKQLKEKGKLLFTKGNIEFYSIEVNDELGKYTDHYIINTKNNNVYMAYPFNKENSESTSDDRLFFIVNIDSAIGMINAEKQLIDTNYNDYSCSFHSDVKEYTCKDNKTTIVQKAVTPEKTVYGAISLGTLEPIINVEYDAIVQDSNGRFIVTKDNKNGLISNDGKKILNIEYDYLIQNENFGYIAIKNDELKVFDNKLKEVDLKTTDINKLYKNTYTIYVSKLKKDDEKINYLTFTSPNSYYWTSDALVTEQDLTKKNNDFNMTYTGNKYTGKKIIIFNESEACYGKNPYIYILDGNKAYKTTDIKLKYETCF